MTRDEIAALLAYASRLDPRTMPATAADADDRLDQWETLLADVPPTGARGWDASRIVRERIAASPYPIIPADIARAWTTHRRDAIGRHTDPTPAASPDDPQLWMAQLRAGRAAVATGKAAPAGHAAALGGRLPLAALTAAIGRPPTYVPETVRQQLAEALPGRARREEERATDGADPLSVRCGWCGAREGDACRRMGRTNRLHPRTTPHPSRIDAAHAAAARQEAS